MADHPTPALTAYGLRSRARAEGPAVRKPPSARSKLRCKPEEPVCTDCGLLKCLCRPRFFAGQLLSEQDLNRLDAYIQEKQRLHNRQLHGWGVVNGLEVTCDPCGTGVTVGCGYALSPCGDDIVVCESVAVDVCALIGRCREEDAGECDPMRAASPAGCLDLEEDWVLAIRYAEKASRGVLALRGQPCQDAGCRCHTPAGGPVASGCGAPRSGGGSCGCGCGGSTSGASAATTAESGSCGTRKPRAAPPECEPTVVCETFRFEVFRKPPEKKDPPSDQKSGLQLEGPLWDRFVCCAKLLFEGFPPPPGTFDAASYNLNPAGWNLWACRVREHLAGYLEVAPVYDCQIWTALARLVCPDPQLAPAAFAQAMAAFVDGLTAILIDAVLACFCSALLPPCPEPIADARVPLATIRVRRRDCKIVAVCDWTPLRRFVVTAPNLSYWLSLFLPVHDAFRQAIHGLCCAVPPPPPPQPPPQPPAQPPGRPPVDIPRQPGVAIGSDFSSSRARSRLNPMVSAQKSQAFASMAVDAAGRGNEPLEPAALVGSLLGLKLDPAAKPLSEAERANLPQFLVLNQILRPLVLSAIPPEVKTIAARFVRGAAPPGEAGGGGAEMEALRARMRALEAVLEAQDRDIRALRERLG